MSCKKLIFFYSQQRKRSYSILKITSTLQWGQHRPYQTFLQSPHIPTANVLIFKSQLHQVQGHFLGNRGKTLCSDFIGCFQHSTFLSVLLRTKCYTEGCSKQVSTANSSQTKRKSCLNSHRSCAWTWNCIRRTEKAPRLSMLQLSDQTKTHKNQIPLPIALRKPSSCIFFSSIERQLQLKLFIQLDIYMRCLFFKVL